METLTKVGWTFEHITVSDVHRSIKILAAESFPVMLYCFQCWGFSQNRSSQSHFSPSSGSFTESHPCGADHSWFAMVSKEWSILLRLSDTPHYFVVKPTGRAAWKTDHVGYCMPESAILFHISKVTHSMVNSYRDTVNPQESVYPQVEYQFHSPH